MQPEDNCANPRLLRNSSLLPTVLTLFTLLAGVDSSDAQVIYRCTSGTHVTLTDHPCDGSAPPSPNRANSSDRTNTQQALPASALRQQPGPRAGPPDHADGQWHGGIDISVTSAGKPLALTPKANTLNLSVDADGTVNGSILQQGCLITGRVSANYNDADHALSLSAHGCRENALNLNYTGTLQMSTPGRPAHLAISGLAGFTAGRVPIAASLRADLMRDGATPARPTP